MIDECPANLIFKKFMFASALQKKEEPYEVKYSYLLYINRLCVTHILREKVMYESHACLYARH